MHMYDLLERTFYDPECGEMHINKIFTENDFPSGAITLC